jgi:hypothetical protein
MTEAKKFAAVAVALTTLFLATGCGSGRGFFGEIHTVSVEVTGTGARASEITFTLPATDGTERDVSLPWKKATDSEFVPVRIRAVPAPGTTVTCRIVVDRREVTAATGTAGAPAECRRDRLEASAGSPGSGLRRDSLAGSLRFVHRLVRAA